MNRKLQALITILLALFAYMGCEIANHLDNWLSKEQIQNLQDAIFFPTIAVLFVVFNVLLWTRDRFTDAEAWWFYAIALSSGNLIDEIVHFKDKSAAVSLARIELYFFIIATLFLFRVILRADKFYKGETNN